MIKRLTVPLLLSIFLLSCSYQTRFKNLIRNHPDLNNHVDTIEVETKVHTPATTLDTTKAKNEDYTGLDSLFSGILITANDSLQGIIDSLKTKTKIYIQNRKCFKDTMTIKKGSLTIKLFEVNGSIQVQVNEPAKDTTIKTVIPVKKIIVAPYTKGDKFKITVFNWLWLPLLILIMIIIILYLWKKPR